MSVDFKDQVKALGARIASLKDSIHTEEATKNAFIMPFLQVLGYDVFNPFEVVPEFISDIGIKKGEKIDYAIFKDGSPTILIECKHWKQNLDPHDGQLLRYFHVSKAKFSILTNGLVYRFYSDLVLPNRMDEKPFLEFNITDIRETHIDELKKFHKANFDVENIVSTASELKYTNELKAYLHEELMNPSEAFVKHFTKMVYPGSITGKVLEQFSLLIKKSITHYLSDLVTDRLKSALAKETKPEIKEDTNPKPAASENKVETTDAEKEGYFIVKSILRTAVDGDRVTYRDAQSYFGIFMDDNNRKPICRLYLNGKKKQIGLFDEKKAETKIELTSMDHIYQLGELLIKTAAMY